MTEYLDKLDDEMASWIITSTCQLLPKSCYDVSHHMHNLIPSFNPAPKEYSIMCGSMVEFYIRPLHSCITDYDYLMACADELAFSGDFPVLPCDRSGLADKILFYKIESYHRFPGFVRLGIAGEMTYNWKWKKYEFHHAGSPDMYIMLNMTYFAAAFKHNSSNKSMLPNSVSGPAITNKNHHSRSDAVLSVWCPQWPREAQCWPIRPRNYGWPTTETISQVIQQGCHVVYVQHRACRDDNWQWRLSFSIAEVILLQSWTQIQQIAYHLLRFFAKKELIQNDCPKEDEVLCTYHLKTLMLWTCEEMSSEWWNFSSVIAICSELLQKLSEWLKRGYCPNYFIPEGNLFYEQWSSTMFDKTVTRLNEFSNSGILCDWFLERYILPVARKYFNIECATKITQEFVIPLFENRKANEPSTLDSMFSARFINSCTSFHRIIKNGYTSGIRESLIRGYDDPGAHWNICGTLYIDVCFPEITNILCFMYYDNLLYILGSAYSLDCGEISWDDSLFVEFVKGISMQPKVVRSQYHNFPKAYTTQGDRFQFLRAQYLMENLIGLNSRSECQLLSLMSIEFLRKALENGSPKRPQCNCMSSAVLAYLAALKFATSEYQQAINFCSTVLVDQTPQKDKEALNAGCLLFIDDIARIVGLCVLHKKITCRLHYIGRRLYLDLRLSPNVLAQSIAVSSAERMFKYLDFSHDLPDSSFLMDKYLKALINRKCFVSTKSTNHVKAVRQIVYRRTDSVTETDSRRLNPWRVKTMLIGVLMEYALENMTSFYNEICEDGGIQCNTAECYRALYLYKCRQYDEVLHICERILHEADLPSDLKEFALANVLLLPPLDYFFDGDVQSLLGFHTLCYYLSSKNNEMWKFDLTKESTFAHWFARKVYFKKRNLSGSLREHYYTKCHYFLRRHFLARYLKVRCCIDCNLPYTETIAELSAMKSSLPFEHIIHRYLLEKFRVIKKIYRMVLH